MISDQYEGYNEPIRDTSSTTQHNWKSDNDYSLINANNLVVNGDVAFDNELVVKSDNVIFNNTTYFNNDIYLYGNSLKFDTLKDIKLNGDTYRDNLIYVNEFNKTFNDEEYATVQNDVDELNKLGIPPLPPALEECSYFNTGKDPKTCKDKIWRALGNLDSSTASVCNCCCSPETNGLFCIVQLIKSGDESPHVLELRGKGSVMYTIVDQSKQDNLVQISLQKTGNIKTVKLLFFNVIKTNNYDDNNSDGLVKIIFSDGFDSNIIEYPSSLGIKSIKLIIE
jgi:hypothetical protein